MRAGYKKTNTMTTITLLWVLIAILFAIILTCILVIRVQNKNIKFLCRLIVDKIEKINTTQNL